MNDPGVLRVGGNARGQDDQSKVPTAPAVRLTYIKIRLTELARERERLMEERESLREAAAV